MSQNWNDNTYAAGNVAQSNLQQIENNFASLKSNFSGTSAPSNPVEGMVYFNTTDEKAYVYNGATWQEWLNYTTTTSTVPYATNADTVDGSHASAFASSGHNHSALYQPLQTYTITGDAEAVDFYRFYTDYDTYPGGSQKNTWYYTSYGTTDEWYIGASGTIRLYCWLQKEVSGGSTTIYFRPYKNGVAAGSSELGTNTTTEAKAYWDISVSSGDLIQLATRRSGTNAWLLGTRCFMLVWAAVDTRIGKIWAIPDQTMTYSLYNNNGKHLAATDIPMPKPTLGQTGSYGDWSSYTDKS